METAAYHLFRTFGRGIRFLIALATLAVVMTTAGCRQDRGTWEEEEAGTGTRYRLWFREPATMWEAALPLGNGHLGMMPDGHLREETIVLNDITLWSGGVQDADNPEAAEHLPEIRRLLFEGRNDLAQELVYNTFRCKGAGSGHGNGTKVPYSGDPADIADNTWTPWPIDLAAVGVSPTNVTSLTIGIEGGQAGLVYIDAIRLVRP